MPAKGSDVALRAGILKVAQGFSRQWVTITPISEKHELMIHCGKIRRWNLVRSSKWRTRPVFSSKPSMLDLSGLTLVNTNSSYLDTW